MPRLTSRRETDMKHSLILSGAAAILLAACASPAETPEATAAASADPAVKYYGDTITTGGALAIADFVAATTGRDSLDAKVDVEIITSCKKKGCWMDVKLPDDRSMTVRFKDYGFFVPTEGLEGKRAVIQGHAVKEVTSVEALRHYAEDAGKSAEEIAKITAPDTSWTFTADGVVIRD